MAGVKRLETTRKSEIVMNASSSGEPLGCGEGRKASQDGSQGLPLEPSSNRHVLKAGILGAKGREDRGCQVWVEHAESTITLEGLYGGSVAPESWSQATNRASKELVQLRGSSWEYSEASQEN